MDKYLKFLKVTDIGKEQEQEQEQEMTDFKQNMILVQCACSWKPRGKLHTSLLCFPIRGLQG